MGAMGKACVTNLSCADRGCSWNVPLACICPDWLTAAVSLKAFCWSGRKFTLSICRWTCVRFCTAAGESMRSSKRTAMSCSSRRAMRPVQLWTLSWEVDASGRLEEATAEGVCGRLTHCHWPCSVLSIRTCMPLPETCPASHRRASASIRT